LIEGADKAASIAASALPPDFPGSVADPIFSGLKKAAYRLGEGLGKRV
jgi:hypothetical protein